MGFSTKIHAIVDALAGTLWVPLDFVLTPGQSHDCPQAEWLLASYCGNYVIADKGYDSADLVDSIQEMGAVPVIPSRSNSQQPRDYDRHLYRERHLVECFFNKIKWFRRIFTRFEKLDRNYLGFLSFVSVPIWLR